MALWDDVISAEEQEIYRQAGFGGRIGLGRRPACLVIDVSYGFVGVQGPIRASLKTHPLGCGEEGWQAVPHIQKLLAACRAKQLAVVYTTPEWRPETGNPGATKRAGSGPQGDFAEGTPESSRIVAEIAPQPGESVIYKQRASAFFGTPLIHHLTQRGVDTLLVCGATTSGCVRASVVEAFSYGFRVAVVEECTFDRAPTPHKVNLWDMHSKYADVMRLAEVVDYLENLRQGEWEAST